MWLWDWLVQDDTLTGKLRAFSVRHVKISEEDMTRTRKLVKDYIEDRIMAYCRQNSELPILNLQYTGSVYERLKTEAADEVDVMVVLKTSKPWFWGDPEVMKEETGFPGYVRLKATVDSKLRRYVSPEGYIIPGRLRERWFFSLVSRAVTDLRVNSPGSNFDFVVRQHGPSVQLDIFSKETGRKLLSADLVPCFQIGTDEYFVAKQHTRDERLWRRSFSLEEKRLLKCMDKDDHGCRHELLRIVKTIVNKERTSLGQLRSYYLKTAFMHYIKEKPSNWNGRNSLGEHFVGFLAALQAFLEKRNLPNYWLPEVNLLDEIPNPVVVGNMAYRLKRILNSEVERNKILE